jgi:hypothetical protein
VYAFRLLNKAEQNYSIIEKKGFSNGFCFAQVQTLFAWAISLFFM